MHASNVRSSKLKAAALSGAIALALVAESTQAQTQSAERKNMTRVGYTELQGRPAYWPHITQYPNGRWYAFVGMHSGTPVPVPSCPAGTLPNPLNGNQCESNGTMIVDVTDPSNPVEVFLIPSPPGGQAQTPRTCLGSQLPGGIAGNVYLSRNVQGGSQAGYEVWDVTNPSAPVLTSAVRNIRSTHKHWWECNTGIKYMPGSHNATLTPPGIPLWRQSQSMLVYDWNNPHAPPRYIRTFGLPGAQPGATGPVPTSLHGPISTFEHPMAALPLTRGHDLIGNRIYLAWGVGDDGVMTVLDRRKLLPPSLGGTWVPATANSADAPTEEELIGPNSPTVVYFLMSPDQGGHTSMPVFRMQPPSYQFFNEFQMRDIVLLASESTANRCNEAPHWTFVVDVTVENSMSVPPGTRLQRDPYHGPMSLSTMAVDPRFGERFPRGNYCTRGARFGVHSSEENFNNPLYGRLTAMAYFTGGVRVYDIREPHNPLEVAFYVPLSNARTHPNGYMTNNLEIDDRGFIYAVDRNGAGMEILQLTGCAKQIQDGVANAFCPRLN